jgi:hypothetical protein
VLSKGACRYGDKFKSPQEFYELEYRYCDGNNYKTWGRVILNGAISIHQLQPHLYEGEFFLPGLVGLPELTPEIATEYDHPWHTLGGVEKTSNNESLIAAGELVARFKLQSILAWGQWAPQKSATSHENWTRTRKAH